MKISIDISSDKIRIFGLDHPIFLERTGVDVELGKVLVNLDKEKNLTEILVLNGPWGFTNLRVSCLALNLLKTLKKGQLSFFSLSKIELYQHCYRRAWISRYGAIYIGQKSNVRLRDFEENKLISPVKKDQLSALSSEYEGLFVDQVYERDYFDEALPSLDYTFEQQGLSLHFKGETYHLPREDFAPQEVEMLHPNYMIEPNIS